jgi:hypothetical protein
MLYSTMSAMVLEQEIIPGQIDIEIYYYHAKQDGI